MNKIVLSRRAQVSMEYLVIVGFVVVIVIPMVLIFYTYSDRTEDQVITNQINKIGLKIGDASEAVYYLGEPSRTRIRAYFPKNINNVTIGNNEITFIVHTKDGDDHIVIYTAVPVSGSLDTHAGYHNINVKSMGDYVEIED
ncbi:hypothetical protein KY363_05090 [Candidatus Woesearchaeota archaeon]|nr:hypothetical protein [Candidatus Woesearchaeota archaeon]